MPRYRAVMDTNVFLGALWSTQGAAYEILQQLRLGRWQMLLSNHLLLEYEEVAKRHAADMDLTLDDIDNVLNPICTAAEQHQLKPEWPPQLSDPDDEPLFQLAVEAGGLHRHSRHSPFETRRVLRFSGPGTGQISGQYERANMTTIQAQVPDALAREVTELADREKRNGSDASTGNSKPTRRKLQVLEKFTVTRACAMIRA